MERKEMERLIISSMLQNEGKVIGAGAIAERIKPELFGTYRNIAECVIGGDYDIGSISKKTKIKLSELLDLRTLDVGVLLEGSIVDWIDECYKDRIKSRLAGGSSFGDVVSSIDVMYQEYLNYSTGDEIDNLVDYAEYINRKKEYLRHGVGITTGFDTLDEYTMGFNDPMVWVLGGYSGVGKTFLLLNFILKLLEQDKSFLFFSLEMGANQIIDRLVSLKWGMGGRMLYVDLKDGEQEKARQEARTWVGRKIRDGKLKIITDARDINHIAREIKTAYRSESYYAFGVDYIQLIGGSGEEYSVIRNASIRLQELSKQHKTIAMLLSQISNEANKSDNMFTSFGFKGAGEIGQIADFGIRIGRGKGEENIPNNEYFITLVKNRHGATGTITCEVEFPSGRITEQEVTFDDIAK